MESGLFEGWFKKKLSWRWEERWRPMSIGLQHPWLCTGATAGGLWRLDVEGPGFDSVTEYLSSWARGKRRGQLGLRLKVPLKWGRPVLVSIFRCGRNKGNHDNHNRLKPLPSFSKYSVISQNSCMILDGEDLPPITGGRTPFLQNHIALNFLLTLLGEGRLEPKPN